MKKKICLIAAAAFSAIGLLASSGIANAANGASSATPLAHSSKSSFALSPKAISPGCDGGLLSKPDVTPYYYDHFYGDSRLTACEQCDTAANLLVSVFGWRYTWCAEFGNNEIAELWYGGAVGLPKH